MSVASSFWLKVMPAGVPFIPSYTTADANDELLPSWVRDRCGLATSPLGSGESGDQTPVLLRCETARLPTVTPVVWLALTTSTTSALPVFGSITICGCGS